MALVKITTLDTANSVVPGNSLLAIPPPSINVVSVMKMKHDLLEDVSGKMPTLLLMMPLVATNVRLFVMRYQPTHK